MFLSARSKLIFFGDKHFRPPDPDSIISRFYPICTLGACAHWTIAPPSTSASPDWVISLLLNGIWFGLWLLWLFLTDASLLPSFLLPSLLNPLVSILWTLDFTFDESGYFVIGDWVPLRGASLPVLMLIILRYLLKEYEGSLLAGMSLCWLLGEICWCSIRSDRFLFLCYWTWSDGKFWLWEWPPGGKGFGKGGSRICLFGLGTYCAKTPPKALLIAVCLKLLLAVLSFIGWTGLLFAIEL